MVKLVNVGLFSVIFKSDGSLNLTDIFTAIRWALPLVLTGMSVAIAFRAGLFNIGGQGQMIFGGVWAGIWAAYIVPLYLPFFANPFIIIPTTLIVAGLINIRSQP